MGMPGSEIDAAAMFCQNRLGNRGADAVHCHEAHSNDAWVNSDVSLKEEGTHVKAILTYGI
jgi:hypothetical protein